MEFKPGLLHERTPVKPCIQHGRTPCMRFAALRVPVSSTLDSAATPSFSQVEPEESIMKIYLITGAIAMILSLSISQNVYAQETAPCYANVNGQLMHVITSTLESCARTIQATRPGYGQMASGRWGGHQVAVDQNSNVYIDRQLVGRARNLSGGYGSLSDRCQRGDVAACHQWRRQTENAIEQYNRMYPPGWSR